MSPSPQGAAARGAGAAAPPVGTRHGHTGDTALGCGHGAVLVRTPGNNPHMRHSRGMAHAPDTHRAAVCVAHKPFTPVHAPA